MPAALNDFENFDGTNQLCIMGLALFGFKPFETVYLSPAPLYHAAPIGWTMAIHSIGGTCVIMEKFDEVKALELIEKHKCTTGQFVPTHFIRMLKMPAEKRLKYDVSSLKGIFHAAAPCPVPVKKAMIEWCVSISLGLLPPTP